MRTSHEILRFESVAVNEGVDGFSLRAPFSMVLRSGECAVIRDPESRTCAALSDLSMGMCNSESGAIFYRGEAWGGLNGRTDLRMRTSIGRIWAPGCGSWISNLSVLENVTLAQRHISGRPDDVLQEEAVGLLKRFGFSGNPAARPESLSEDELERAGWARAFMGEKHLFLADYPDCSRYQGGLSLLSSALAEKLAAGCGLLWIAGRDYGLHKYGITTSYSFSYHEGCLSLEGNI